MKKILVVEDDLFLVKVYELKLKEKGYELVVLNDGVDVVATVKQEKPDLVVLDILLPTKSGLEALAELRSDSETKDVCVLIVSNLAMNNVKEQVEKLKVNGYITKSETSFKDVIAKIEAAIATNQTVLSS